jgi:hypothetical protein
MTKADAQLRMRMSDQVRSISNKVGPAGSFSLEYELVRAVPGSMEELIQRKSVRHDHSRQPAGLAIGGAVSAKTLKSVAINRNRK